MRYAWDYQEDEPLIWWNYFLYYCALGPGRSVARARAVVAAQQVLERRSDALDVNEAEESGADSGAPLYTLSQWRRVAHRDQWQARARAWDLWFIQRARTPAEVLTALEQRRRDLFVRQVLNKATHIFDAADLENLNDKDARRLLPAAQGLARLALQVQREVVRSERQTAASTPAMHEDDEDDADFPQAGWQARMLDTVHNVERLLAAGIMPTGKPGEPTASELIAALDAAQPAKTGAQPPASPAPSAPPAPAPSAPAPADTQLLVVTGSDHLLEMDVAMVRAVARTTGLRYQHIAHATRADLEAHLRRARSLGRPIPWVHMACHVSHAGVLFADGLGDGAWLSSVLMGVEVLLIAGCNGDRVGDWLAVVPYVITLSDKISHDDAATLTHHFWEAMAREQPPTAALAQAMARCPQVLWESVVTHW